MTSNNAAQVFLYGAYGYTGKLIAHRLSEKGIVTILGGKNPDKLLKLSEALGMAAEVCKVADLGVVLKKYPELKLLINAAGPFVHTAENVADACIENKIHYIDITGEIPVFQLLEQLDQKAKDAGIMLLPGAGFDVVPTDCLAKKLSEMLPDASHLELAFVTFGGQLSRGTTKSVITHLNQQTLIRENGTLKFVDWKQKEIDFQGKKIRCYPIRWGDLQTAFVSTGIPNIVVYHPVSNTTVRMFKILWYFTRITLIQKILLYLVGKALDGPDEQARNAAITLIKGTVLNEKGEKHTLTLQTPEGYSFTAISVVEIAERILKNQNYKTGFQTPSVAYGSQFIETLNGVNYLKQV